MLVFSFCLQNKCTPFSARYTIFVISVLFFFFYDHVLCKFYPSRVRTFTEYFEIAEPEVINGHPVM